MFGIEIRRKNNIHNLYSDVNLVLSRNGVEKNVVPNNIAASGVAHALNKMLNGNYFDICVVRECVKLTGLIISSERMSFYSTQHCIYWNEMLEDHRQVLVAMILDDFKPVLNPEKEIING